MDKSSKAAAGPCRNTKANSNNQEEAAVQWLWDVTVFLVLFCGSDHSTPPRKQAGNKAHNAKGLGTTYFKASSDHDSFNLNSFILSAYRLALHYICTRPLTFVWSSHLALKTDWKKSPQSCRQTILVGNCSCKKQIWCLLYVLLYLFILSLNIFIDLGTELLSGYCLTLFVIFVFISVMWISPDIEYINKNILEQS